MKLYLENLISRLKEFSLNLDKQEVFVDKQWVIIDENQNKQTYIFRRNGELIMSINGQVTLGKWDYISAAKSLLIDRIQDKILLNQNFIDPAVMILKKDGFNDDNFIMVNEHLIPELDVIKYLNELYYSKNNIKTIKSKDGSVLELKMCFEENVFSTIEVTEVRVDGKPVADGRYELNDSDQVYLIEKSKLSKILYNHYYETNNGMMLKIEQHFNDFPRKGDMVYQNNVKAPNGKYKLGKFKIGYTDNITVVDGVIIKKTVF